MATNLPYVVSGTITDTDATNPNGAKVILRNDRSGEKITTTTNSSGQYVFDAGNLSSGYVNTDRLTVICAFGDAKKESSFLISDNAGGKTVNLTLVTLAESSDTTYCQPQDVLDELGDKTTSDISFERVRSTILRAETEIDEKSNTKFSSTTLTQEEYDFNQYTAYKSPEQLVGRGSDILTGTRNDYQNTFFNDRFKLNKAPILTITTLQTNTGPENGTDVWTTRDQQTGSGGDFIVDNDIGLITFVNNVPAYGKRKVRVTYNYGFSSVPKTVERLCILLSVKSILSSKANASQFDSVDSISLPDISISKGTKGATEYLQDIRIEIADLWEKVGEMVTKTV